MKVIGKGGISAEIIADSTSSVDGKRIVTFCLEYPRFIHAEFMTHRQFSRNAASSRAIPVKKIIEQVENTPAMPIHWGKNQPGMKAKEELLGLDLEDTKRSWCQASKDACFQSESMVGNNAHKQIVNRILEPYQFIKVVCTATEFDNFFWLRCHADAQPEIKELAECMYEAYTRCVSEILKPGEWHTPYVSHKNDAEGNCSYYIDFNGETITLSLEEALKVSSSCCAQVSFRALNNSLEKACDIYKMLVESKPVHASPFEHSATPMGPDVSMETEGVTSFHKHLGYMSGNFAGYIQYRQLIDDHCKW